MPKLLKFLPIILIFLCCKKANVLEINNENIEITEKIIRKDTSNFENNSNEILENKRKEIAIDTLLKTQEFNEEISDEFVNLKNLSNDFVYDIKYATTDNFLKQAVYECPECYLRKKTALALIEANEAFKEKGYKILIYDCYRPLDVQKKMWAILPGTHYVANPKKGSKHNRGAAVDLTLIDKNGQIVDMGTVFDFFGKEAHHTYTHLSKEVLDNRKLLRETLKQYNFKYIYSEWWHYEYRPEMYKPVSNFKWDCE